MACCVLYPCGERLRLVRVVRRNASSQVDAEISAAAIGSLGPAQQQSVAFDADDIDVIPAKSRLPDLTVLAIGRDARIRRKDHES